MSNSVVTHILAKKKEENKDVTRRIAGFLRHEASEPDAEIEEMLSSHSIEQVRDLLRETIEDKTLLKRNRTYVVTQVLRNQPHAVNNFKEFYDWNRDLWQSKMILILITKVGAIMGALLVLMPASLMTTELLIPLVMSLVAAPLGGFAFYWYFTRNNLLFIQPKYIYKERLTNGIETDADRERREQQERAERKQELEDELAQLA